MKRIFAVLAALALVGCTGQSAPEPTPTPTPSAPATVALGNAQAVNLPLGTTVNLGHISLTAIGPDGATDAWKFRVRACMNPETYTSAFGYAPWGASSGGGEMVMAVQPPSDDADAYGRADAEVVRPGRCMEGPIYLRMDDEPDMIYYTGASVGAISWRIQ